MGAILDRLDDDENARRLLRARLSDALEQARTGDLAEGDGETAMRRAFAAGGAGWSGSAATSRLGRRK